jgi:hypothetical protein
VETVRLPDSVIDVGADCFANCRQPGEARLRLVLRARPERLLESYVRLRELTVVSVIKRIGDWALSDTKPVHGPTF